MVQRTRWSALNLGMQDATRARNAVLRALQLLSRLKLKQQYFL